MQSYQLHIVSEQLKKRHPYLQPPFKARYDPTIVYKAVFDRAISKLIEILLTQGLTPDRYTNALITLNEMASDETEKSKYPYNLGNMIEQGCVGLASAFCHCKHFYIRREATLLLGLLLSTPEGLTKMTKDSYSGLKKLLDDEEVEVRNAVSWAICRMSFSRLGAEILCKEQIMKYIVQSFLKYSGLQDKKEQHFITYLLQSFKHLLAYDAGIKYSLQTGLTARLKSLTSTTIYSPSSTAFIHYLSLSALSCIAMNQEGKAQCVHEQVIKATQHFLESAAEEEVAHEVTLIMFTSIHLIGKKQCIYNGEGKVDTKILIKLIKLLEKENINEIIKGDVRQTLKIIAQEMDGFLAIADYMSRASDIKHIQAIFGSTVIIPLALLLPKISQIAEPPTLPSAKINDYKAYSKTINHFLHSDPASLNIALKDCVDLATKLVVFLCYRGDKILQEGIVESLTKLCSEHQYSKKMVKDFIDKYGDVQHKISKTTVKNQIKRFQKLCQLLSLQNP